MDFSSILEPVFPALPPETPIYLVGGAVRDGLLGRTTHDLDFVLQGDVLGIARRIANRLGAAYYPLDIERDTGRVILIKPGQPRLVLDFAAMRGPDLESDLLARDFTVNAIAVDVRKPETLIDFLGGVADLHKKQLRPCSTLSFQQDPLRVLRAIRLATTFKFRIPTEATALMRQAVPLLAGTSPERLRDELFRILAGPQPASAVRALDLLGALDYVLPELPGLKGVQQSAPHVNDVWEHTLDVLAKLEALLEAFDIAYDPDKASSLIMGLAVLRLGRYREQIHTHLEKSFTPDRSLRPLLFFAALYHDVAKPKTFQEDAGGQIHFYEHEHIGAKITAERAQALRLSNLEVDRLKTIIKNHLRPHFLAQAGGLPSRRAIYRFFHTCEVAGVDICLLAMADFLATYGAAVSQEAWEQELEVIRALLEAWWEKPTESVTPPTLVSGRDVIQRFRLKPGPEIGRLLALVREAQAEGRVTTVAEAYALIDQNLHSKSDQG